MPLGLEACSIHPPPFLVQWQLQSYLWKWPYFFKTVVIYVPKLHVLLYQPKLELLAVRRLGYSDPYQVGLKETRQDTAMFDTVSEASGLIALQFTSIVKIVFHGVQRDCHIDFAGNNTPVWQTSSLARNTDIEIQYWREKLLW